MCTEVNLLLDFSEVSVFVFASYVSCLADLQPRDGEPDILLLWSHEMYTPYSECATGASFVINIDCSQGHLDSKRPFTINEVKHSIKQDQLSMQQLPYL